MAVRDCDDYLTIHPNWGARMSQVFGWRTTIQTTINGTEKRAALLTWYRKQLRYKIDALDASEVAYLKRKLFKYLYGLYGIPAWPEQALLSAQAGSGQKELNVDSTTYKFFAEEDQCIILDPDDDDNYEVGVIDIIEATKITLKSNLSDTWALGCEVYPLLVARLQVTEELSFITDGICRMGVDAVGAFELTQTNYTTTTTTT